ncbi:MAG: hypothetical protein R3E95_07105 [Thiolinea sp.]
MPSVRIRPALLCSLMLALSATAAQADQCAYLSVEQAARALNYLKPASVFVHFCEPCGDRNFWAQEQQTVEHLAVRKIADLPPQVYWEIEANGRGIDLAYTFLKLEDSSYMNLSKLAQCPSRDVTAHFSGPEAKKL